MRRDMKLSEQQPSGHEDETVKEDLLLQRHRGLEGEGILWTAHIGQANTLGSYWGKEEEEEKKNKSSAKVENLSNLKFNPQE